MLPSSYFDGSFMKKFAEFEQRVLLSGVLDGSVNVIVSKNDLSVSSTVLDVIRKRKPHLEIYLLFFCRKVKIVRENNDFLVYYPYHEGLEKPKSYFLENKVLGPFISCRLYTLFPDYEEFDRIMVYGSYVVPSLELYPDREVIEDGQLKILTDLALAVSHANLQPSDRVLVIGSSSPNGVFF